MRTTRRIANINKIKMTYTYYLRLQKSFAPCYQHLKIKRINLVIIDNRLNMVFLLFFGIANGFCLPLPGQRTVSRVIHAHVTRWIAATITLASISLPRWYCPIDIFHLRQKEICWIVSLQWRCWLTILTLWCLWFHIGIRTFSTRR